MISGPLTIDHHGYPCPDICDVKCTNDDEIYCEHTSKDMNNYPGCLIQDGCVRSYQIDTNGDSCPVYCPGFCAAEEKTCPGPVDAIGCRGQETCEQTKQQHGHDGFPCETICPVYCLQNVETYCPGGVDTNGCPLEGTCQKNSETGTDVNDNACPVVCPVHCIDNELYCPGITDDSGCKTADTCQPPNTHVGRDGDFCQSSCPAQCLNHELECTGEIDTNDCPIPETCELSPGFGSDLSLIHI